MKHPIEKAVELAGSQLALAASLGVSKGAVWQWINARQVPASRCLAIEQFTKGLVTRRDLRPNDWRLYWPDLEAEAAHA